MRREKPRLRSRFAEHRTPQVPVKSPPPVTDKLLLTIDETAAALNLGRSETYAIIRRGQLPSIHIGSSRRVPVAALEAFLRQLGDGTLVID